MATDLVGRRVKVIGNESWGSSLEGTIGKYGVIIKPDYKYLKIKLDDDTHFIWLLPNEIVLLGANEM